MKPLSPDTPPEIERLWIAGLRQKGPVWRLRRLVSLTHLCWRAASEAYQRARPCTSDREQELWLLQERYGSDLVRRVEALVARKASMAVNGELWEALLPVVDVLEKLGVPYGVGGSVASSVVGVVRATLDVDLVADLRLEHAEPLAGALSQDYYVDVDMITEAIRRRVSFNVIHLATMFKIDVFVMEDTAFARQNMARRIALELPDLGRTLYFTSPEDIVLHKLLWYAIGGGVSDRQWYDLQGVLRLQAERLDLTYMRRWAEQLGIRDLLQQALAEAGLAGTSGEDTEQPGQETDT
jgi:hypothetical protein